MTAGWRRLACSVVLGLLATASTRPATAATPHVTAGDATLKAFHLRLDADASWGVGAQMFLGAQLHILGQLTAWHAGDATGTFDVGLRLAYGNEPAFLAPWREPDDGLENHRFQAQVSLGGTFHMLGDRSLALGFHALVGWSHYNRSAELDWETEGIHASAHEARNDPVVSGEVTLAYRFHERVGLNLAIGAPLPTTSSYLVTLLHVSLGLSFYLL